MPPPARENITGLVLAGGRGSRMGGIDKGWALHDGQPLILRVLGRLSPQVGATLISANRNVDRYRALAAVVTDADAGITLEEYAGPLAGVLAGLRGAPTAWIATVPCDAPSLPGDLVERLAAAVGDADAAFACAGGQDQPAFALLKRTTAEPLAAFLQQGGRAIHRWLHAIGAVQVVFDDVDAFRNVNATTADERARG